MNTRQCLFLLALCACACARIPGWCQNHECADFTVLEETQDYELRRYRASKWISAQSTVTEENWIQIKDRLFGKLFGYFQAGNDRGVNIGMTAPVLTKVEPRTAVSPRMVMTMYLLIPSGFREDTPPPSEPDVTVVSWPERDVYVRSFTGAARKEESLFHLAQLRSAIGNDSLYDNSFVIKAQYSSPKRRQRGQYSEIWLMKI